jgi:hypothetical protein
MRSVFEDMEQDKVTEAARGAGDRRPVRIPGPQRTWRGAAVFMLVTAAALAAAAIGGAFQHRRRSAGPPGWVAAPVPAPRAAEEIAANVQRLIVREGEVVSAAAARAGRLPNLAALITSSIDGAAFQDALSNEAWWKEFRGYGSAVLVGDEVKVVWHLPSSGLPAVELARKLEASPPSAGAQVVAGPTGFVLGAVAPIDGVKGARVLLAEALDRQHVAVLAARANSVMMLSDGKRDLGASVPDPILPQLEGLVGHEPSRVMVEKHLSQLAVAVPWTSALWLWVITGSEP